MSYAKGTSVSVDKSQIEIKKTLSKYKATGFAYGELPGSSVVMFELSGRRIKFMLPMPEQGKMKNKRGWLMTRPQVEQEARRRWRCMALAIKSKLECVESGITTLEQEFLAHIVLPNGKTMGEIAIPQIAQSYQDGKMPALLGYSG